MTIHPRTLLLVTVAALGAVLAADPAASRPTVAPSSLCAPLLPAKAPLPTGIGLPALVTASLPISAHARSRHALCRVGVYSPSDDARYNVNWYVFPSHALALADLKTLNVHTLYASVGSLTTATGFPKPAYLLTGTYLYLGRPESIVTVSFVDGPALVSGSMLGGGSRVQADALARWAERDLTRLEARG